MNTSVIKLEDHKPDADTADRDLIRRVREMYDIDWNADEQNRDEAMEDLLFRSGEQWDADVRATRESEDRPIITINRSEKFISQVVGDVRNARPTIIVKPDGFGADHEKAAIINGIVRNIQRRARSTEPYVHALDGAVSCGMGHFRIITEYLPDNPFDAEISVVPIMDHLSVVWDANARMADRSDARHCYVLTGMERSKFEKKYPGRQPGGFESPDHLIRQWYPERDQIMIAEFFELVDEETTFVKIEGERVLDINRLPPMLQYVEEAGMIINAVGMRYPIMAMKKAKATRCKWYRITGQDVLEKGEWVTGHIPIVPILGQEIQFSTHTVRTSLLRWAKEPMRLSNYHLSTMTEMVANMPKAPLIVPLSGLDGVESNWENMNKANKPYLPYNDIREDGKEVRPPARQNPPVTPPGLHHLMSIANDDIKDTTGIYNAALGQRSNEVSGKAILARQSESDVATNIFGSRLTGALERAGKIIVAAIPRVYDTARAMKIVHEDDTDQEIKINQIIPVNGFYQIYNDITMGRYDVSVDIGPGYASQQQQAIEGFLKVTEGMPEAKMAMMDLIVKGLNAPNSAEMVKRMRKIMPPGMVSGRDADNEEVSPAQQQAQKMEQMMMELEMRLKNADASYKEARATKALSDAERSNADSLLKKIEAAELSGQVAPGAAKILQYFLQLPLNEIDTPSTHNIPNSDAGQANPNMPMGAM